MVAGSSAADKKQAVAGRSDIHLGVQNIYWEPKGAFTGETSAEMAVRAGAALALVGHSERRHVFGETNDDTRRKVEAALRAGLAPMLCVGELLEERESGRAAAVVEEQLQAVFANLSEDEASRVAIAYEPVWAIGTGRTATPADVAQVHAEIRRLLVGLVGEGAEKVRILYGGSVKPDNARELLSQANVDGALVGGASLDAESFWAIAESA